MFVVANSLHISKREESLCVFVESSECLDISHQASAGLFTHLTSSPEQQQQTAQCSALTTHSTRCSADWTISGHDTSGLAVTFMSRLL